MNVGRVGCALWPGASPEWTFIVGPGHLIALPVTTPAHLLEAPRNLDQPSLATADDVLALIPLHGDEAVDRVAVVILGEATDADGVPMSVTVRGAVAVDVFSVGGSRRILDSGRAPWFSAAFVSVTGLTIGSPGIPRVNPAELGSGQTIGSGAISGSALFWSALLGTGPAEHAPHAVSPTYVPASPPIPPSGDDFDDTVLRPPRAARPTTAERDGAPAEDTVLRAPVAPPREPREEPASEPAGGQLERYGFRLPDGTERRLDTAYLLGRRPQSARIGAGRGADTRLITIGSRTSAVSATHLEIRQDGDSVVVTDVGSTNGTIVLPELGRRQRLRPGQSVAVRPGTRVDIGDGNIIEVLR